MKVREREVAVIDQEEIAKKLLNAPGRGRKTGEENLPPSNAVGLSDDEKYFKRNHESLIALKRRSYEEGIQRLENERTEILDNLYPDIFDEPREVAEKELVEAKIRFAEDIKRSAKHRNRLERRLAALKNQDIDVTSSAVGSYLLVYGLLIAFLIVESLANSYFIGQASDYGLLGERLKLFSSLHCQLCCLSQQVRGSVKSSEVHGCAVPLLFLADLFMSELCLLTTC